MVNQFHPVTHVIFDMDGLLLDTEPRWAEIYAKILKRYGKEYTLEAKIAVQGRPPLEGTERLVSMLELPMTPQELLDEILTLNDEVFDSYIEFMPGAERIVKHLKDKNVPICIATSCLEQNFQILKERYHGKFYEQFHHIIRGPAEEEVKHGKPAPDIFLVAAKRFGDSAPKEMKNVLVFEDSVMGVKAGLAAGMQVVWVPSPIADTNEIEATLQIPSLDDFKPELFGLPAYD